MKRNLNESSARSTAGCLPVPLFNQKKRNRQPLTSNPLQNDPGVSTVSDSYGSPSFPTDWAWEAVNPEVAPLKKTVNTGQIPASASYPWRSQDSVSKSIQSNAERSQSAWGYRGNNRNTSLRTWDFRPQHKTEGTLHQLKEKDNSLRIISAVIESMKYWRAHVQKTVLLFEILAVLDSAVTSGPHYSKTFLMRDGKNILPCVFYEIDRELPRLIRGRVHRCVGHYDPDKNIFKCVSVRPASASEQKTFQAFVTIADAEMKYHTKVTNEM